MQFLRKLAIVVACFILFSSLITFGELLGLKQVIGRPQPVEHALQQTNVYGAIIDNFIQSNQDGTNIGVPLTPSTMQAAIHQAFPPSVVKSAVNQIIDAAYDWTDGKTTTLTFRVDLTVARDNLATDISQAVAQHAATLPKCTFSQLRTINLQAISQDPYTAPCLPPGVTSTTIGGAAKTAVLNSKALHDPVITPSSLDLTSGNQLKIGSQPRISPPHIYRDAIRGLWVTAILAILCISIIVWLHRNHWRGTRRAGAAIGWAGLVCILDAIIIDQAADWLTKNNQFNKMSGQQVSQPLQRAITQTASILARDFHQWMVWYGSILFVIGLGLWGGIRIWQHRNRQQAVTTHAKPV